MRGLAICFFLISSLALAQPDDEPPDYVCVYAGPLKPVNAKEWGLKIDGPQGDGSACIAKVLCKWNYDAKFPPSGWTSAFPAEYESSMACAKESDGTCRKSYQDCQRDQKVTYVESQTSNRNLGIRNPRPSGGNR